MYRICGVTDRGLVYKHNEDCYLINQSIYTGKAYLEVDSEYLLAAVADGVGGENAGEVASRICAEKLSQMQYHMDSGSIRAYIEKISSEISEYAENRAEFSGMATTLAGVLCDEGRLVIFNVGNSRVYRYRNGYIRQFSVDDSLVQAMYEAGQITKEEMLSHPNRHILLQAIGGKLSKSGIDVHIQEARNPMSDGDILLLCTDGLSDLVSEDEILGVLEDGADLGNTAEKLVEKAKAAGGYDNITVLLIEKY